MNDSFYGELCIIGMRGCEAFTAEVDNYIKDWRRHVEDETYIAQADSSIPKIWKPIARSARRSMRIRNCTCCLEQIHTKNMTKRNSVLLIWTQAKWNSWILRA